MSSNQTEKFNLENQIDAKIESRENKMDESSQEMDEFFDARNFVSKSRNIICPNCSEKVDTVVKFKRANCCRKWRRIGCLAGSFLCCLGYVQIYIYIHLFLRNKFVNFFGLIFQNLLSLHLSMCLPIRNCDVYALLLGNGRNFSQMSQMSP